MKKKAKHYNNMIKMGEKYEFSKEFTESYKRKLKDSQSGNSIRRKPKGNR